MLQGGKFRKHDESGR